MGKGYKIPNFLAETYYDHRIAMSFAIAGLNSNSSIVPASPESINTSFPEFIELGKKLDVILKLVKNIITIDGPSGVGKGLFAFSLAERLEWNVLDSGLLYRLVGHVSFTEGLETTQEIVHLINQKSNLLLILTKVFVK